MSRWMRNIDRFGSPPISGANFRMRASISPMRSRIGARSSVSYSSRCASNHSLLLFFASPRRKRRAAGVKAIRPRRSQGPSRRRLDDQLAPTVAVAKFVQRIGQRGSRLATRNATASATLNGHLHHSAMNPPPDLDPVSSREATERARRWRLVLGSDAETSSGVSLTGADAGMDQALRALYGGDPSGPQGTRSNERRGGLGSSAPS